MAKLADASALGADGVTLGGSNPLPPNFWFAEEDLMGVRRRQWRKSAVKSARQAREWPTRSAANEVTRVGRRVLFRPEFKLLLFFF